MNRTQIIFELGKYCHPSWYHSILSWDTHWLRALLEYYQAEDREITMEPPIPMREVVIGIDVSIERRGEPLKNKMRFDGIRPRQ